MHSAIVASGTPESSPTDSLPMADSFGFIQSPTGPSGDARRGQAVRRRLFLDLDLTRDSEKEFYFPSPSDCNLCLEIYEKGFCVASNNFSMLRFCRAVVNSLEERHCNYTFRRCERCQRPLFLCTSDRWHLLRTSQSSLISTNFHTKKNDWPIQRESLIHEHRRLTHVTCDLPTNQ